MPFILFACTGAELYQIVEGKLPLVHYGRGRQASSRFFRVGERGFDREKTDASEYVRRVSKETLAAWRKRYDMETTADLKILFDNASQDITVEDLWQTLRDRNPNVRVEDAA